MCALTCAILLTGKTGLFTFLQCLACCVSIAPPTLSPVLTQYRDSRRLIRQDKMTISRQNKQPARFQVLPIRFSCLRNCCISIIYDCWKTRNVLLFDFCLVMTTDQVTKRFGRRHRLARIKCDYVVTEGHMIMTRTLVNRVPSSEYSVEIFDTYSPLCYSRPMKQSGLGSGRV